MTTVVKAKVKAKNGPMVRIPKEKEEEMHRLYETYCSQGLSYNDAYNRAESEILNGTTNKEETAHMNKYQQRYLDIYYDGKKPRDKGGKEELALLGNLKSDHIRVHFPDFKATPAHAEEYHITDKCNMPEGVIDVETLSSNLRLWTSRGYEIEYLEA